MTKKKGNANDKLVKWLAFGYGLDTSKMRDLTKEEEDNCSKALDKISEKTDIKLFEDWYTIQKLLQTNNKLKL